MNRYGQSLICTFVLSGLIGIASAQQPRTDTDSSRQQPSPQLGSPKQQTPPHTSAPTPGETDNTRMNQRDREEPRVTADQQQESESDRKLSAAIRKSITDDKNLSTYAHNVKIITQNGMVTLRGPVRSDAEKRAIESAAKKVTGDANVKSEITIEPEKN